MQWSGCYVMKERSQGALKGRGQFGTNEKNGELTICVVVMGRRKEHVRRKWTRPRTCVANHTFATVGQGTAVATNSATVTLTIISHSNTEQISRNL